MPDKNSSLCVEDLSDGTEEFKVSLMLHLALLLFFSAVFALKVVRMPEPRKIVPIRFVGAVQQIQAGSGLKTSEELGARKRKGIAQKVAKKKPERAKSVPKSVKKDNKNGEKSLIKRDKPKGARKKVGKSSEAASQETPLVVSEAPPKIIPRPYLAPVEKSSMIMTGPATTALPEIPLLQEEPGEPEFFEAPLEAASLEGSGRGSEKESPSGISEGHALNGAAVEIEGIETLSGGEENFTTPKVLEKVLPVYPEWARKQGVKGLAIYKVLIQESGKVSEVISLGSTIDPKLAVMGSQSLRRWVFSPVTVNGDPREAWVKITMQFKLQ